MNPTGHANQESAPAAKRWIGVAANAGLLLLSTAIAVFAVDGFIGRFLYTGASPLDRDVPFSNRQTPNANYRHDFETFSFSARHNSDGFRNAELPSGPTRDGVRIALLGDSFAYGWGVDEEASWARVLERTLNESGGGPYEVLNLAMYGTSPNYSREVLETFGPRLQPDIVLVGLYQNNDSLEHAYAPYGGLRRMRLSEKSLGLYPKDLVDYAVNHFRLLSRRNETSALIPSPLEALAASEDPLIQANLARMNPEWLEWGRTWRSPPYSMALFAKSPDIHAWAIDRNRILIDRPFMADALDAIRATAEQWGGEVRIVLFPQPWTVDPSVWPEYEGMGAVIDPRIRYDRRFQDALLHFAANRDIPALDLRPAYLNPQERAFLKLDEHMNAAGNAIAGLALARWLLDGAAPDPEIRATLSAEVTTVARWDFDGGAEGWTIWPKENSLSAAGGILAVSYGQNAVMGKPVALLNREWELDCAKVNRLRFRMKAPMGVYAQFLWGAAPHYSNERMAVFPIAGDGEWREYDIALDHFAAGWEGAWTGIRFEPAYIYRDRGDTSGMTVEIDYLELGYAPPVDAHPNLWDALNALP